MKKDNFLAYYNQEMNYLRQAGARFAQYHPRVAERLKIDDNYVQDPHTERLIESFAFLTSRINYKIDENFAELAKRLLDVLYPHLVRPIPATTIAQVALRPSAYETLDHVHFERHHSMYALSKRENLQCRFRTVYPLTLWPMHLNHAHVHPYDHITFNRKKAPLYLGITLTCKDFSKLKCDELVFHIQAPLQKAFKIHQTLFQNHTAPVWMIKDDDTEATYLGDDVLEPVGLEEEDVILPTRYATNFTYHLLHEYFTFPEKFMFFRVKKLLETLKTAKQKISLLFPIEHIDDHLIPQISHQDFTLNAVPIVNLFHMKSDPIILDHAQMEYRLSPQENHDPFYEVYSVEKVSCTKSDVEFYPFFDIHHHHDGKKLYWTARRDSAQLRGVSGSDVFMSFITHDFKPIPEDQLTVYADILATNRDLTNDMQKNTALYSEHNQPFDSIICTTHPRSYPFQYEDGEYLWKLIAQLSLNHMSFSNAQYSLDVLQELLRLHSHRTSDEKVAECIEKMEIVPAVRRMGEFQWRGFVRGIEIILHMKEMASESYPLFLLSMVLNTFMSRHVAINSFVSLKVVDAETKDEIITWHPKIGVQKLL